MKRPAVAGAFVVALLTLGVYLPALNCGFINLDDPFYITNNPLITSLDPASLRRIFSAAHLSAWVPLTYLSFAVDYHFWGTNPTGYHLTNILLHAVNAALVVLLADSLLTRIPALHGEGRGQVGGTLYPFVLVLAGLLWSLHPLRVESVAWAAERKDVLNGLFVLATLLAYLAYVQRKAAGERHGALCFYLLAVAAFVLSLLAKQVSVTLPVVLLLLDWYPLGRYRKGRLLPLLAEKVPFFAGALLITLVTLYLAAADNKMISLQDMPLYVRMLVSGNAIFEYCRLTLFPVGINPYVVLPKPLPYGYLVKTACVAVVSLVMLRSARRWPAPAAAWFVFVILLAPMLAFLHAGDDIALAARYTYLPALAPTCAAAAGLLLLAGWLCSVRPVYALLLLGGVAAGVVAGSGVTLRLIDVWHDTGTFWSRVIAIEPVGRAYGDRGVFYIISGRSAAAVGDFTAAIAIAADVGLHSVYNLYAFRGVALSDTGRFAEAVADFDRAIARFPHPTYYQLRGEALNALGRSAEAAADFRRAGPTPPPIDWF